MKKRHRFVMGLACGLLLAGILWPVLSPQEPVYKKRRLSEWVATLGGSRFPNIEDEANEAIRTLGTNAIPWLMKWIQYEESRWHAKLRVASERVPSWLGRGWVTGLMRRDVDRKNGAVMALVKLGPEAAQTIPELTKMVTDPAARGRADAAVNVLQGLGTPALSALSLALTNGNAWVRAKAALSIRELGTNGAAAVPLLIKMLEEPDGTVRASAIAALSAVDTEGKACVPGLLKLLNDPALFIRHEATNAVLKLAPEALPQAGINVAVTPPGRTLPLGPKALPSLIADLTNQTLPQGFRRDALTGIRELGTNAGPAVPALIEALKDPDGFIRICATNALYQIDPKALKKMLDP